MNNYVKIFIPLLSTTTIVIVGGTNGYNQRQKFLSKQNSQINSSSQPIKKQQQNSSQYNPRYGSPPTQLPDILPIIGSLGPSKNAFFNDRLMAQRFNKWKVKKDLLAKTLYQLSDQYQKDTKQYYKGTKKEWFTSSHANQYYEEWRKKAGQEKLITAWKKTNNYNIQKTNYVRKGSPIKRSKTIWLHLSDSSPSYNKWRFKHPLALKNAWEATRREKDSFKTKLNVFKTNHPTNTKEKYANLPVANSDYNTWRLTRTKSLQTAWEKTNSKAHNFFDFANQWFMSHHTSLNTKDKWIAASASNNAFAAWKAKNAPNDEAKKLLWEATIDFYTVAQASTSGNAFANAQEDNFKQFFRDNIFNQNQISNLIVVPNSNTKIRSINYQRKERIGTIIAEILGVVNNNAYEYLYMSDGTLPSGTKQQKTTLLNQLNKMLNDMDSKPLLKNDIIHLFDELTKKRPVVRDNNYDQFIKKEFKLAKNKAAYNNGFKSWKKGLKTYWAQIQDATTAYHNYQKKVYKDTISSTIYHQNLDLWSATKANGLIAYKTSSALINDYATWIKTQYKAATATYNQDLDAWSAIKSNGVNLYNNDPESTVDYNQWQDPLHKTTTNYDNNHLGQFQIDLDLWTKNKSNGQTTYLASEASNQAFNHWINPAPNNLAKYYLSPQYVTNFDYFITHHLTWTNYRSFFQNQKYKTKVFREIYYQYLLNQ